MKSLRIPLGPSLQGNRRWAYLTWAYLTWPFLTWPFLFLLLLGCKPSVTEKQTYLATSPGDALSVRDTLAEMVRRSEVNTKQDEFDALTRSIAKDFEEIPVTVAAEPLKWSKVTLNRENTLFDGVRFRSPLDVPADMRLAFILAPGRVAWFIVPMAGEMPTRLDKVVWETYLFVDFNQCDVPFDNRTFLQPLDGGHIKPGQEYILWFCFTDKSPRPIHLAIRLAPEGTFQRSTTSVELACDLGLPVPFSYNDVRYLKQLRDDARASVLSRDVDNALQLTEEFVQQYPMDREMLFWASSRSIDRGEWARDKSDGDPKQYFFAAAKYMRELRERCDELDEDEKDGLAEAIYYEAQGFALEGNATSALASLKESLAAGYNPALVEPARFESVIAADELASVLEQYPAK